MRRIAFISSLIATIAAAFAVAATADDKRTYLIEMYNAFGIVPGSDVRVAGVNAGSVTDLEVNSAKRAVVEVELAGPLAVLGENTTCSTEPQSLIAEYFISCDPDGPAVEPSGDPENPDVPADRVEQTVQPDLVANTLREPYKRRLQLLINEFGTALAGNADNLNEAIRLGAPALSQLEKVLRIMADQNKIIRDLNVDSDKIIGRLTERREDVIRFIEEARDTAAASAERREDLSTDFALLDDFLAELKPTLAELETLARVQTPLLTDLRAAAPGLNTLMLNLPAFNSATELSLESLGDASVVGERALREGKEEIDALGDAGQNATPVAEMLADFLRDIDDTDRVVEEDARAARDTGDPGRVGYKGLEGLLNYGYYQAGSLNQFDTVGHLLHFNLYYIFSGPCGIFTTGRDPDTGDPGLPALSGPDTTNIKELEHCVGWTGRNQPGINEDLDLPPYSGGANPARSVCPTDTEPDSAEALCDSPMAKSDGGGGEPQPSAAPATATAVDGRAGQRGEQPGPGGGLPRDIDDLLDVPDGLLDGLPRNLQDRVRDATRGAGNRVGGGRGGGQSVNGLLDYLLGP